MRAGKFTPKGTISLILVRSRGTEQTRTLKKQQRASESESERERERNRKRVSRERKTRRNKGRKEDKREVAGYAAAFSWLVGDRKEVGLESRSCEKGVRFSRGEPRCVSEEERIAQVRSPVERPSGGDGGGRARVVHVGGADARDELLGKREYAVDRRETEKERERKRERRKR